VIMAANDGERKAARPSASPAFRLELAAVSSAVVGLGLALARRRASRGRSAAGRGAGVWEPVFVDEAPDGRCYGGVLVVGEINRRHGLAAAAAPGVVLCVADGIVRIVVHVVAGEDLGGRLRRGIDRLVGVAAGEREHSGGEDDAEPPVGRLFSRCAREVGRQVPLLSAMRLSGLPPSVSVGLSISLIAAIWVLVACGGDTASFGLPTT
jgi:hypothetical protein